MRRRRSSSGSPAAFGPRLVRWYRSHRRPLPWRADRDPYRIWIAETMLQQTRVAQAAPYFERFVARYPTVAALAQARDEDVLRLWQGLGYYGRARRLPEAARRMVREHGGDVPSEIEALERLPGIGPYIARAVASLAYGRPTVALEANGVRVAARWWLERGDPRGSALRRRLERRLDRARPADRSAEFNEALMELGETICTPVRPKCGACPIRTDCRALHELPDPGRLPTRRARPGRPHVRAAVVALQRGERWLLQRRPADGLLGGLWEFPGGKIEDGESARSAAERELREEVGVAATGLRSVGPVRHAYSHFSVELHVFRGRPAGTVPLSSERRWFRPGEIAGVPIPRATGKIFASLGITLAEPPRSVGPRARGASARARAGPADARPRR